MALSFTPEPNWKIPIIDVFPPIEVKSNIIQYYKKMFLFKTVLTVQSVSNTKTVYPNDKPVITTKWLLYLTISCRSAVSQNIRNCITYY